MRLVAMCEPLDSLRLDKWLWAARFYKTRSLATDAINGGHVHLNSERVKPAKAVKCGDSIRVRKGTFEVTVTVQAISDKRGAAPIARTLYEETAESVERRELARDKMHAESALTRSEHKPNKQERRELVRIKKQQL